MHFIQDVNGHSWRGTGTPLRTVFKVVLTFTIISCFSLVTGQEKANNVVCSSGKAAVTLNGTHLVHPFSLTEQCQYEIQKQDGICQVRLDFNAFSIDPGPYAKTLGNCTKDTFDVSGQANPFGGPMCGDLTGQHMYLTFGDGNIQLEFQLRNQVEPKWDIVVTMIRCGSSEEAPAGCLQYHTGRNGSVKSFNYEGKAQLNNQNYSVCVLPPKDGGSITWKPCSINPYSTNFVVSGGPAFFSLTNGTRHGFPSSGSNCTTDWVLISGEERQCGNQLPERVTSTQKPFNLHVHFDEYELPPHTSCSEELSRDVKCPAVPTSPVDVFNFGFCLSFVVS